MQRDYSATMDEMLTVYETPGVQILKEAASRKRWNKAALEHIGRAANPRNYVQITSDHEYFASIDFSMKDAHVQVRVPWAALKRPIEVISNKPLPDAAVDNLCYNLARKWIEYKVRPGQ